MPADTRNEWDAQSGAHVPKSFTTHMRCGAVHLLRLNATVDVIGLCKLPKRIVRVQLVRGRKKLTLLSLIGRDNLPQLPAALHPGILRAGKPTGRVPCAFII